MSIHMVCGHGEGMCRRLFQLYKELQNTERYPPGSPDMILTLRGQISKITVCKAAEILMQQTNMKFRSVGYWARGMQFLSSDYDT